MCLRPTIDTGNATKLLCGTSIVQTEILQISQKPNQRCSGQFYPEKAGTLTRQNEEDKLPVAYPRVVNLGDTL